MSLQGHKGKGRPLILIQSQLLQILGNSEEEKKESVGAAEMGAPT